MVKIETYELTHLYKELEKLEKKDMTASGIHLQLSYLDGSALGEMDFIGELLGELIPTLKKSIRETLELRQAQYKSDLAKINQILGV